MKKILFSSLFWLLITPTLLVSAFEQTPVYVEKDYLIIRPTDEGSIALMHMTSIKNMQEEDYLGDGLSKAVLNVHIPQGATNLQVHDNSLGMKQTDLGFYTTKVIPAKGSIVLPYSYWLEMGNGEIELQYDYPVEALQLLIPDGAGSLEITDLIITTQGSIEFDGQKYYGYQLEGIEAKKSFTINYNQEKQPSPVGTTETPSEETTARPEEGSQADNPAVGEITHSAPVFHNPGHLRIWYQSPLSGFEPHVLLGVLVVITVGGVGYYSYFRWKSKLEEERSLSDKEEQAFLQLIAKRKAILDKIVELEELYSGGQIEDDDYHKKMNAYKYHLIQVKLNLQKYTE